MCVASVGGFVSCSLPTGHSVSSGILPYMTTRELHMYIHTLGVFLCMLQHCLTDC